MSTTTITFTISGTLTKSNDVTWQITGPKDLDESIRQWMQNQENGWSVVWQLPETKTKQAAEGEEQTIVWQAQYPNPGNTLRCQPPQKPSPAKPNGHPPANPPG